MQEFILFISSKAKDFLKKKLKDNQAIKIRFRKSGCSGYAYELDYVQKNESNLVFNDIPFDILIEDFPLLNNTLIDLKTNELNSRIVFDNPNTTNHCGCGESFSLGDIK